MSDKKGVLLVNLGSPAAPTAKAVKVYLSQLLSDHRMVSLPSYLWQPLLHLFFYHCIRRNLLGVIDKSGTTS